MRWPRWPDRLAPRSTPLLDSLERAGDKCLDCSHFWSLHTMGPRGACTFKRHWWSRRCGCISIEAPSPFGDDADLSRVPSSVLRANLRHGFDNGARDELQARRDLQELVVRLEAPKREY